MATEELKISDTNWKKLEIFLKHYEESLNITRSAKAATLSRTYIFYARKRNPQFAERYEEARLTGLELLEERALERTETSDTLMIFMLKGNLPNKYGDKQKVEMGGNITVSLNMVLDES